MQVQLENALVMWEELKEQLHKRDEKLGEVSDLHRFLQNLDHFQQWLTRTQSALAGDSIPTDLAEAEQMLSQHQLLKEEIDGYADNYAQMRDYGRTLVDGQTSDAQYMFLREVRLS